MKQVLLDTSFLLRMAERSLPTFAAIERRCGPCRFAVLDGVLDELRGMVHSRSAKRSKRAKLALQYASTLATLPSAHAGTVDERLIHVARQQGAWVATLDQALRAELRRSGVPVITLRRHEVHVEGSPFS